MNPKLRELLKTEKKESLHTKVFRMGMNLYPMFFGTGGKVLFWSADWREVHVRLTLNMWTKNYVGTIFGGSMFSVTDPFYMLMYMHALGDKYVVWDKSANIRYRRPAKKALYTVFKISDENLEKVQNEVKNSGETTFIAHIQWVDHEMKIYSELERTIYIADKNFYKAKQEKRKALN